MSVKNSSKGMKKMRKKVFSQLDTRWCRLPYPTKRYNIGTSGCGCCAVANLIIELSQYWNYTPKTIQPYMKQFAVPAQGTKWAGITEALKHYDFTVKNPQSMADLFKILNDLKKKHKRTMGILLFRGGTKGGVTWTTSGHYVAFADYKYKNGKHYFYMKDSGGRHNTGWFCFETKMKGLIVQCWNAAVKNTTGRKLCSEAKTMFKEMHERKFKYQGSGNSTSWNKAKTKQHTSNCATYVSYALQVMKLLKDGQVFWCNDGKVKYRGSGTEKQLKKVASITHPKKPPMKCGLKRGDICGYSKPPHTQIFFRYDKNGNAIWYSFGPSDLWKKMPRKRGNYNNKKIDTIIRLK